MPLEMDSQAPTMLIRRAPFEAAGLSRSRIDEALNLTAEEFRVEGDLIAVGPLFGDDALELLTERLESLGLVYFDDFFELSGNWPAWMALFAGARGGRSVRGA